MGVHRETWGRPSSATQSRARTLASRDYCRWAPGPLCRYLVQVAKEVVRDEVGKDCGDQVSKGTKEMRRKNIMRSRLLIRRVWKGEKIIIVYADCFRENVREGGFNQRKKKGKGRNKSKLRKARVGAAERSRWTRTALKRANKDGVDRTKKWVGNIQKDGRTDGNISFPICQLSQKKKNYMQMNEGGGGGWGGGGGVGGGGVGGVRAWRVGGWGGVWVGGG